MANGTMYARLLYIWRKRLLNNYMLRQHFMLMLFVSNFLNVLDTHIYVFFKFYFEEKGIFESCSIYRLELQGKVFTHQ